MPLTNPNKVVTEERLSEFYGQILPYMGGMPDVLANKFSKGDLYSTDEKMIGQWIDGKPLYQKTVTTGGNVPSGATLIQRTTQTGYDTILYTKTTDSPIAIGSDTDYSTDEKIIGTWVSGEPLYQKYVEVPSKGTTWQNIYQQNGIDIKFCTFIQLYWNDANILWMPMAYYGSSSVSALYGIKGDAITASTIKSGSSYPIRMNIVYTKTS